jgi:hypothetical protein
LQIVNAFGAAVLPKQFDASTRVALGSLGMAGLAANVELALGAFKQRLCIVGGHVARWIITVLVMVHFFSATLAGKVFPIQRDIEIATRALCTAHIIALIAQKNATVLVLRFFAIFRFDPRFALISKATRWCTHDAAVFQAIRARQNGDFGMCRALALGGAISTHGLGRIGLAKRANGRFAAEAMADNVIHVSHTALHVMQAAGAIGRFPGAKRAKCALFAVGASAQRMRNMDLAIEILAILAIEMQVAGIRKCSQLVWALAAQRFMAAHAKGEWLIHMLVAHHFVIADRLALVSGQRTIAIPELGDSIDINVVQ